MQCSARIKTGKQKNVAVIYVDAMWFRLDICASKTGRQKNVAVIYVDAMWFRLDTCNILNGKKEHYAETFGVRHNVISTLRICIFRIVCSSHI